MTRYLKAICLVVLLVAGLPYRSPAPFVYRPGEGWTYEAPGSVGNWMRGRAKDQLDVAQAAFDKNDYKLAVIAARRVVTVWPLSDYAPQAQYLIARCSEAKHQDERAFAQYQTLLEKYPKSANYPDVLQRQYEICNRFLAGERFRLWGYLPTFPSMEKTIALYEKVIKNGPYSDVAPQAQMNIGEAHEKQTRFLDDEPLALAASAYELAADRYHDRPAVAADALYKQGLVISKQARTAEYDQSTAERAINTFVDFMTLYPDDPRVKSAQAIIDQLKAEQALGNYKIARYYDSKNQWQGASIYYNEVVTRSPDSPYKDPSLQRLAELKKLMAASGK